MASLAKVGARPAFVVVNGASTNVGNLVDNVIVADADLFVPKALGGQGAVDDSPGQWLPTSYNTQGGIHLLGGTPVRGNYAGIDWIHDRINDVFYPPQPYPSWTISAPTWAWTPPTPMPTDGGFYVWNESTQSWVAQ
jgi:hypothetical protein